MIHKTRPVSSEDTARGAAALKSAVCQRTVQLCEGQRGSGLLALLLTGSLARDEATFVREGERWKLLGDAEFLLVFDQNAVLPPSSIIDRLEQEIEHNLLQQGLSGHVELSPVHTRYLRMMPPEILAYELRTYGQVVWGERQILSLIPAFSPSDIPLEDGWRMLCNRMVEFIEVIDPAVEKRVDPSPHGRYRMIKLYLDMATSFLLFQGAYAPTYLERAERLRALAEDPEANRNCPFPLRGFAERVVHATQVKLQAGDGVGAQAAEEGLEGMFSWAELVNYARRLWRWELERLLSERWVAPPFRACPERSEGAACRSKARRDELSKVSDRELMRRWMRLQPVRKRLRGWASALRRCGWHRSWRHWPRWVKLGWRASPRYWVYAAASEFFFRFRVNLRGDGLAPEVDSQVRTIRSWLPVAGDLCGIGENLGWREVAADIAWNYRAFLTRTRS
jgi:hypothetical protein